MTIISPLPFTLTNGTTADATQVMADLNQIRNDVNSNAAGGGGSGNVVGPGSAIDGHLAVFDGITGKIIKDGGAVPSGSATYRGCVVYNSTNQALTPSSSDKIAFNTETIDTDSIHSTSVNNTRLTVPAGVTKIRLIGQLGFNHITSGVDMNMSFIKNNAGITPQPVAETNVNGTYAYYNLTSPAMVVIAGDYFEMSVVNQSAAGGDTVATGTWFEMQILT